MDTSAAYSNVQVGTLQPPAPTQVDYNEFLTLAIDRALDFAIKTMNRPGHAFVQRGYSAGLQDCVGQSPEEIYQLVRESKLEAESIEREVALKIHDQSLFELHVAFAEAQQHIFVMILECASYLGIDYDGKFDYTNFDSSVVRRAQSEAQVVINTLLPGSGNIVSFIDAKVKEVIEEVTEKVTEEAAKQVDREAVRGLQDAINEAKLKETSSGDGAVASDILFGEDPPEDIVVNPQSEKKIDKRLYNRFVRHLINIRSDMVKSSLADASNAHRLAGAMNALNEIEGKLPQELEDLHLEFEAACRRSEENDFGAQGAGQVSFTKQRLIELSVICSTISSAHEHLQIDPFWDSTDFTEKVAHYIITEKLNINKPLYSKVQVSPQEARPESTFVQEPGSSRQYRWQNPERPLS